MAYILTGAAVLLVVIASYFVYAWRVEQRKQRELDAAVGAALDRVIERYGILGGVLMAVELQLTFHYNFPRR